jgi:hypothetical protein
MVRPPCLLLTPGVGGMFQSGFELRPNDPTHAMKPHEWGTRVSGSIACMGHPPFDTVDRVGCSLELLGYRYHPVRLNEV